MIMIMNMNIIKNNKDFILGIFLGVNISFLFFNFGMTYLNINYDLYKKRDKHIL